jgi:hypothetical protein
VSNGSAPAKILKEVPMFPQTFEKDSLTGAPQNNPFNRWEAPSLARHFPMLWAEEEEEEQECEDEKTTREVEAEKQKDKKRGQQDDKPQPPKNIRPRQKK